MLRVLNCSRQQRVIARICGENTFNYFRTESSGRKVQSCANENKGRRRQRERCTEADIIYPFKCMGFKVALEMMWKDMLHPYCVINVHMSVDVYMDGIVKNSSRKNIQHRGS